jgi:hypothetical protein
VLIIWIGSQAQCPLRAPTLASHRVPTVPTDRRQLSDVRRKAPRCHASRTLFRPLVCSSASELPDTLQSGFGDETRSDREPTTEASLSDTETRHTAIGERTQSLNGACCFLVQCLTRKPWWSHDGVQPDCDKLSEGPSAPRCPTHVGATARHNRRGRGSIVTPGQARGSDPIVYSTCGAYRVTIHGRMRSGQASSACFPQVQGRYRWSPVSFSADNTVPSTASLTNSHGSALRT